MVRIGILGAGRIGKVHAASVNINRNSRLVAVSDAFPEAAESLANEYSADVRTSEEIIAAGDIDAIIICTPTDTHCNFIEEAMKQGKAVLCEKPVDMSAERIKQCLTTIESAAAPLLIGFNRRFDPGFANLQRRLSGGEIGSTETVTITSRDPAPPPISYIKTSGGIFRDMMIHDFDMARFLLGEEPIEIFATGSSLVDPEIGNAGDIDTASVLMKTASGKVCQISNSRRAAYGYDQRIEVHGSQGMLRAGNIHETTVELANASGFRSDPAVHFFIERYTPAYQSELNHFIDCIENGTNASPNGLDGLKAQLLADAADQSWRSGQVVKL